MGQIEPGDFLRPDFLRPDGLRPPVADARLTSIWSSRRRWAESKVPSPPKPLASADTSSRKRSPVVLRLYRTPSQAWT